MTRRLILGSAIAVLLFGCGKRPETSASAPASGAHAGQSDAAASAAGQPGAADGSEKAAPNATPTALARSDLSGAELSAALVELTQALRKYSFEHRRLPKTFSEVIAAGYVNNMPPAPPGKKFEIDPKTVQVVLVKQ